MPESNPQIPPHNVICVFGSGDATLPDNFICHRRVEKALEVFHSLKQVHRLLFYGPHTPNLKPPTETEAQSMLSYACSVAPSNLDFTCKVDLIENRDIINVSKTCEHIARHYLGRNTHVYLVINWIFMPRTYYLLKKWAIHIGLDWPTVREQVTLVHCGNVFLPYLEEQGPRALKRFITVPLRELGAWYYALTDPFTSNFNRRRRLPWPLG